MAKKFTRRFNPDGLRNPEAEMSDYDHVTRSPVVNPRIADWSPQWTVDPHDADMNATDAERARRAGQRSTGPVMTVAGGTKHEIYHIAPSCSILAVDLALARRGDANAHVDSRSLSAARRTGLACIVCLPEVARSRGDDIQMKACTVTTDIGQRSGILLHWRRDDRNAWWGVVVNDDNGVWECEAVPATRLREQTVAPAPRAHTPPNGAAVRRESRKNLDSTVPHDLASARRDHARRAAAGDTDAMRELALLLAYRTDPPDLTAARHWWGIAAEDGDRSAMFHLARLHGVLLDPPDLAGARHWYERAADSGDVQAMRELGTLLVDTLDEPDVEAAISWLEKAATAGDHHAMTQLGVLLGFRLAHPDHDRALGWLTKAANSGNLLAMANLGVLLAYHTDPPDLDGGRHWLTRVATNGIPEAMVRLGVLLAYHVDPPEREKAHEWLELAAAAGDTEAEELLADLTADEWGEPSAGYR